MAKKTYYIRNAKLREDQNAGKDIHPVNLLITERMRLQSPKRKATLNFDLYLQITFVDDKPRQPPLFHLPSKKVSSRLVVVLTPLE